MRDVVGDICEDVFGCINAIKHLVLRQHITDGLPLRQDRGHLQQLLCMLCGETYRLTTHKRLIRCYSVERVLINCYCCLFLGTCCSCSSVMSLYVGGFSSCLMGRNTFCRSMPVILARMSCTAESVNFGFGLSETAELSYTS